MKIKQIVISRTEEPVDEPRGEVFKINLFDSKQCVETFYSNDEADALEIISSYLEDLDAA